MTDEMLAMMGRKQMEAKDAKKARELKERERGRIFKELTYVPPPPPPNLSIPA